MESKFLKIDDEKQWQDLLTQALFKTFFHQPEWEKFLENQFKWLKFEHYNYQDRALLSLARVNGKKLVSHPFCEYGGPLPLSRNIDFSKFKDDLFSQFKKPLKISLHPQILTYFTAPQNIEPQRITYWIEDLHQKTKDQIWSSFRKTLRHSIQKAEHEGLQIEKCQGEKELKRLYNLYIKSAKKHKIPVYPLSFFERFLKSPNSEIVLAKYNDKVIAGSAFLFYDKFIHYFQNTIDEKYKDLGANYLILWQQIQSYLSKGYRVFDFGGTRVGSSLQVFKSGWGGKIYPIFELNNQTGKDKLQSSKLRIIFGFLPLFLIKKLSPYLLKYKL